MLEMSGFHNRRNAGFSLIEVLVALVVLSIGFVGYAALQMTGIRISNESLFRTHATSLAEDMAERMRANRGAVNGPLSFYDGINSDAIDCNATPVQCDLERGGPPPANCSVQQLATYDAFAVACGAPAGVGGGREGGVQDLLPGGQLTVTCQPAGGCLPGAQHDIVITWDELETDRDPDADQDGDDDFEYMTRTLTMSVLP